jgi:O-antigen/teichoic acid export membrane protein
MDARGVGMYNTAKLGFRVFNVLAQAINQVLMPAVSRLHAAHRDRDVVVLFEKSVCFLSLGLIPVCLGLIAVTGPLWQALFGVRYLDAVPAFQILVAGAMFLPFSSVASPFLTALGELRSLLWITWAGLVLGIVAALAWIPAYGPAGAALATTAAAAFGMVARAVVLRRRLGFRFRDIAARSRDAWAFAVRRWRALPPTA